MLTIKQSRSLLNITTRQTINEYLKCFNLFGRETITWEEFRRLLELQTFRGLKPGSNSKAQFLDYSQDELNKMFTSHSVNIERKLKQLKLKHATNLIEKVVCCNSVSARAYREDNCYSKFSAKSTR